MRCASSSICGPNLFASQSILNAFGWQKNWPNCTFYLRYIGKTNTKHWKYLCVVFICLLLVCFKSQQQQQQTVHGEWKKKKWFRMKKNKLSTCSKRSILRDSNALVLLYMQLGRMKRFIFVAFFSFHFKKVNVHAKMISRWNFWPIKVMQYAHRCSVKKKTILILADGIFWSFLIYWCCFAIHM